jgi:hypothetical protein
MQAPDFLPPPLGEGRGGGTREEATELRVPSTQPPCGD